MASCSQAPPQCPALLGASGASRRSWSCGHSWQPLNHAGSSPAPHLIRSTTTLPQDRIPSMAPRGERDMPGAISLDVLQDKNPATSADHHPPPASQLQAEHQGCTSWEPNTFWKAAKVGHAIEPRRGRPQAVGASRMVDVRESPEQLAVGMRVTRGASYCIAGVQGVLHEGMRHGGVRPAGQGARCCQAGGKCHAEPSAALLTCPCSRGRC